MWSCVTVDGPSNADSHLHTTEPTGGTTGVQSLGECGTPVQRATGLVSSVDGVSGLLGLHVTSSAAKPRPSGDAMDRELVPMTTERRTQRRDREWTASMNATRRRVAEVGRGTETVVLSDAPFTTVSATLQRTGMACCHPRACQYW